MAQAGDRCSVCKTGRMTTRTSKNCGSEQIRYLRCNCCGAQGRSIVSADRSWRRPEKVV